MKESLRRALPNSPFLPALLAFVLAFSLCFLYARNFNFNLTAFVSAGHPTADVRRLPRGFFLQPHAGHDGQLFYRLASNPFTSTRTADGITLDMPAYRHQRILYPFVVWCLSLGNRALVPFFLIAVNVFALTALGFIGGLWAKQLRCHAVWGMLLALHPGFLVTLWLDLAEISEAALICAALLALAQRKQLASAVLFSLAILTRETAMVFVVAGFLLWLWELRKPIGERTLQTIVWLLPAGVYLLWQLAVFCLWREVGATSGTGNLGKPFAAMFEIITHVIYHKPEEKNWAILIAAQFVALSCFVLAVVYRLKSAPMLPLAKISWVFYAMMAPCLSIYVWSAEANFWRALSEFVVVGLLIVMAQSSWRMRAVCAATMFVLIAVRANMVLQLI